MKHFLFLFLLLAACGVALAQQSTVDFFAAPGLSSRIADGSNVISETWQDEQVAFAFRKSAAFSLPLDASTTLSIGFGCAFLGSRFSADSKRLTWGSQWNGNEFDPTLPSGEDYFTSTNSTRVHLVEVPVSIRRYMGVSKLRPYVELAAVPSLRVSTKTTTEGPNSTLVSRDNSRFDNALQLAARAGFGLERHFTEQLAGFVQVSGQLGLLQEDKDTGTRLWDAGLQLGMRVAL